MENVLPYVSSLGVILTIFFSYVKYRQGQDKKIREDAVTLADISYRLLAIEGRVTEKLEEHGDKIEELSTDVMRVDIEVKDLKRTVDTETTDIKRRLENLERVKRYE